MTWSRVVLVAVATASLLAGETCAQACPEGQFSVSVLEDPQIKCLTRRPCSGVYGPEGLVSGVGACPGGTGCALLPYNPSVMGCVVAGRPDVSYVNPDGSLTRGGVIISGPPNANNNNANNAQNANNNTPNNANDNTSNNENGANANASNANGANANGANANGANANGANANGANANGANANGANANGSNANGANGANANTNAPAASTPPPASANVPTPAHVKPGEMPDGIVATKAPSPAAPSATPSPSSSGKPSDGSASSNGTVTMTPTTTPTTTPLSSSSSNQQKALDNIDGGIVSNKTASDSKGISLGSIIAVVVGCLAVVAVIAGVFVLRKKKERQLETPAGALDDYMGAGGVTPKENVLLL